jgi:hypothetical protein
MENKKCCICGPVKNCGRYLNTVLENIEKIGAIFEDYKIFIFYDNSSDNSLNILKTYQLKNNRLEVYINKKPISTFRTHNIAFARNSCLKHIKEKYSDYSYFIMMDFDDVNCKTVHPEILIKYINEKKDDWDGLSFQTSPRYYDIWGLSIYPYCFSYNHFKNNDQYYNIIQDYVEKKLSMLKTGALLPCLSAFNGFSIYKTSVFKDCEYDGNIRFDLIPNNLLHAHLSITKSAIIFKKYITVDGRYEDCEHRAFHMKSIFQKKAKLRISPEILFT